MDDEGASFVDLLGRLSLDERPMLASIMAKDQLEAAEIDWPSWAHEGQHFPPGDWRTWVMMAGRGFGKTRAGAEWITAAVRASPVPLKIALVGATIDEARRIMVDGRSGLMAVAEELVAGFHPSLRLMRFVDGSEATLFSGASPEALRGPEHHIAWCDELAKWEKAGETWDMLQLGMRLGARPRVLVTTTPRAGPVLTRIMAGKGVVVTGGSSHANPHLPPAFLEAVEEQYAGTRLGRQEIGGELLPDVAGALWTVELLERCRFLLGTVPNKNVRTVIGVDPPSGDGTCGIIACALDADGISYVLADHSVTARSPEGWARAVAAAAEAHGADLVVAEDNQGGQMVSAVLRGADLGLRVKPAHAATSKVDRATPIAMRFEAGKVRLCGRFPELETELCGMIMGGGYEGQGRSPDRADAMVWALSELMVGGVRVEPRVRGL